jgi:putative polyhydroxyalkanoate system protein
MKIRRRHNLGIEEARLRADRIAGDLQEQFSMRSNWQGDSLHVQGNGVQGQLYVDAENLELDIKLGFALKLMEAPIRAAIEAAIDEELA